MRVLATAIGPLHDSPMTASPSRLLAAPLLVASMSLTGANVPFGKAIVAELPVYLFIAFRFMVASLVLAVLAAFEPGPRLSAMSPRQWVDLLLLGLLGSVLYTVFLLEGARRTAGVDAGIIMSTLPAVAALLGILVNRERPALVQLAAIGLAIGGLVVVQAGAGGGSSSTLGNLLVGLAVLCEASFVLISARMSRVFRPIRLSLGVSLAGLAISLPLAAPELVGAATVTASPGIWALAVWYALTASVLCTILWYSGAPHVETWMAGLATAALPIAAIAVSALYLGESIGMARLAGAVLVIAAIVLGAVAQPRSGSAPDRPRGIKPRRGTPR